MLPPDITRPGGNMYTPAATLLVIRDLDYYHAMPPTRCWLAILPSLDERVLNGLKVNPTTPWVCHRCYSWSANPSDERSDRQPGWR